MSLMYPSREQVRKTLYLIWKSKRMSLDEIPSVEKGVLLDKDYIDFVLENGTQKMRLDIKNRQIKIEKDRHKIQEEFSKWRGSNDD